MTAVIFRNMIVQYIEQDIIKTQYLCYEIFGNSNTHTHVLVLEDERFVVSHVI